MLWRGKPAYGQWQERQTTKKENKEKKTYDIAKDLENLLVLNATELLNGSVEKHAHWQILQDCADWVQQQCRAHGAPSAVALFSAA